MLLLKWGCVMEHVGTLQVETERLLLRKFALSDSEEIVSGFRNQKEFLYFANKVVVSLQEQNDYLKIIQEKYKEADYYNWLITLKKTNQIIGAVNFVVNSKNDSVRVNYAIDNRFTGNGYMTEALMAVKTFSFDKIKVNRFEGGCAVENIASRKVMEKCGLVLEGTMKSYIKLADGYHDMLMFAETAE